MHMSASHDLTYLLCALHDMCIVCVLYVRHACAVRCLVCLVWLALAFVCVDSWSQCGCQGSVWAPDKILETSFSIGLQLAHF